jgi:hypothetical protein
MNTTLKFNGPVTITLDGDLASMHTDSFSPLTNPPTPPLEGPFPPAPALPPEQLKSPFGIGMEEDPTPKISIKLSENLKPPFDITREENIDTLTGMADWYCRVFNKGHSLEEREVIEAWCQALLDTVAQQGNDWTRLMTVQRLTMIWNYCNDGLRHHQKASIPAKSQT